MAIEDKRAQYIFSYNFLMPNTSVCSVKYFEML